MKLLGKGTAVNGVAIAAGSEKRTVVYRGSQEKNEDLTGLRGGGQDSPPGAIVSSLWR